MDPYKNLKTPPKTGKRSEQPSAWGSSVGFGKRGSNKLNLRWQRVTTRGTLQSRRKASAASFKTENPSLYKRKKKSHRLKSSSGKGDSDGFRLIKRDNSVREIDYMLAKKTGEERLSRKTTSSARGKKKRITSAAADWPENKLCNKNSL